MRYSPLCCLHPSIRAAGWSLLFFLLCSEIFGCLSLSFFFLSIWIEIGCKQVMRTRQGHQNPFPGMIDQVYNGNLSDALAFPNPKLAFNGRPSNALAFPKLNLLSLCIFLSGSCFLSCSLAAVDAKKMHVLSELFYDDPQIVTTTEADWSWICSFSNVINSFFCHFIIVVKCTIRLFNTSLGWCIISSKLPMMVLNILCSDSAVKKT